MQLLRRAAVVFRSNHNVKKLTYPMLKLYFTGQVSEATLIPIAHGGIGLYLIIL